jgi:DNA-binding winged helix-turn-helix (wHTH) protein/TolB-like protein
MLLGTNRFEFDDFVLDAKEKVLLREGKALPITPKAFLLLLTLVENHGHLVEKEKLIATVWKDSFVEEGNLAVTVRFLRKMLGDNTQRPCFIETVPKRGYRFIADVKSAEIAIVPDISRSDERNTSDPINGSLLRGGSSLSPVQRIQSSGPVVALADWRRGADDEKESLDPIAQKIGEKSTNVSIPDLRALPPKKQLVRANRGRYLLWAGLFVCIVAGLGYGLFPLLAAKSVSAQPRALAVLPFRNLKPDADTDFLGLALADATINKLDPVHALSVRPSSYVAGYRNKDVDPRQVADELKVDALLMGTFLKDGDNLRITEQLIDVNAGKTISQGEMDVKYDNLLAVESRVAQQVIDGLQLNLSAPEAERLQASSAKNPLAYENYLRGRFLISTANHATAVLLLEKSVELDPNNAAAWAYLGKAYSVSASQYAGGQEYMDKARAAYKRSLSLNPDSIETNVLLANFLTENNRLEESIPLLRGVVAANPNSPFALWELSYAYRYAGMLDESISEGEKALSLYPSLTGHLFNSYLYAGQYDKFIQSLPLRDDAYVKFYRGLGYYYLEDPANSGASFDSAYDIDPSIITSQIGKALSLGLAGRNKDGIKMLRDAEVKTSVSDGELVYKLAQAYAVLNDKNSALRELRRSIESGFVCYPYFINDPLIENIRNESDYAALMDTALTRHNELRAHFF